MDLTDAFTKAELIEPFKGALLQQFFKCGPVLEKGGLNERFNMTRTTYTGIENFGMRRGMQKFLAKDSVTAT